MIKKAESSDILGILEIEKEAFSDPWNKKLFIEALNSENKSFFVHEIEGVPAGFVIFEQVLDEGHITNLAVAKQFRNRGFASELVAHVLEQAKSLKVKEIFLEVRHGNEAAKKLYSRFGFKEIGRRKAYYPKANEDALVLSLKL